jgi:hypothetical protein
VVILRGAPVFIVQGRSGSAAQTGHLAAKICSKVSSQRFMSYSVAFEQPYHCSVCFITVAPVLAWQSARGGNIYHLRAGTPSIFTPAISEEFSLLNPIKEAMERERLAPIRRVKCCFPPALNCMAEQLFGYARVRRVLSRRSRCSLHEDKQLRY